MSPEPLGSSVKGPETLQLRSHTQKSVECFLIFWTDFSLETASEEELEGRGLLSGAAAGARVRVSRDLSHLGSPGSFPCSSA